MNTAIANKPTNSVTADDTANVLVTEIRKRLEETYKRIEEFEVRLKPCLRMNMHPPIPENPDKEISMAPPLNEALFEFSERTDRINDKLHNIMERISL